MKAVLVVDIRTCGDCPCSGEEFGMCQAVDNEKECDYYNIPSWCPLIPLPKGHGRLIDADELKTLIPAIETEYKYVHRLIDEAPTIVEADKGETE